jgi:hypothetical protein
VGDFAANVVKNVRLRDTQAEKGIQ